MLTGASSNGGGGGGGSAKEYLLKKRLLELMRLELEQRLELLLQLSEEDLRVTLEALADRLSQTEMAEVENYIAENKGTYDGPLWQVQPQVLDGGDPDETVSLIDCSHRKWKYTSGVISFDFDDKPTAKEMAEIRRNFEAFMFGGKAPENYNILWVQHGDKGRAENHFLIPRLDLETGQDLNICQRGYIADFRVWNTYICEKYGFKNPLKVQAPQFDFVRENKDREAQRVLISADIESGIANGTIKDRAGVIAALETFGAKTREGPDSFSIKVPGFDKNFRFSGGSLSPDAFVGRAVGRAERFKRRPVDPAALENAERKMVAVRAARENRFNDIRAKSNYVKNEIKGFDPIKTLDLTATETEKKPVEPQELVLGAQQATRGAKALQEAPRAPESPQKSLMEENIDRRIVAAIKWARDNPAFAPQITRWGIDLDRPDWQVAQDRIWRSNGRREDGFWESIWKILSREAMDDADRVEQIEKERGAAREAEYRRGFETLEAAVKDIATPQDLSAIQIQYQNTQNKPDTAQTPTPKWERAFKALSTAIKAVLSAGVFERLKARFDALMAPPPPPEPEPEEPAPQPAQANSWGRSFGR